MQQQIIGFLREASNYISGEEMSKQLKMSRSAIWKHMHHLRELGYEIEAVPHLGYKLTSSPDKLIPDEIQYGLKTKTFGHHIISFDSVASTMDEAFRLGLDGAKEGTVVCAETQTKGRGRLGRTWLSPKGKGLYFSIILRPKLALGHMPHLTLTSAVAITQAINASIGVNATIKWPNDVLIDGKKCAGILSELHAEADQMKFVVIGFGININTSAHHLIESATSLRLSCGQHVDRVQLLREILSHLEMWYSIVLQGDFSKVLVQWKKLNCTLKHRVRVTDGLGVIVGVATDIDKDGALLIRQDNGITIRKLAGDVTQLR